YDRRKKARSRPAWGSALFTQISHHLAVPSRSKPIFSLVPKHFWLCFRRFHFRKSTDTVTGAWTYSTSPAAADAPNDPTHDASRSRSDSARVGRKHVGAAPGTRRLYLRRVCQCDRSAPP